MRTSGSYLSVIFGLIIFIASAITQADSRPESLPTEAFSRLPDVSRVRISPDGSKLVSQVRFERDGTKGVVLLVIDMVTNERKVVLSTDNSKFVLGWLEWAGNDALLVSTFYPSKFYNTPVTKTRMLRVDLNSDEVTAGVPAGIIRRAKYSPIKQDTVIDHLVDKPDEILVSLRTSNEVGSEVYRVNHKTGRSNRVHRFKGNTMQWITDRQQNLRIAQYFKDTTVKYLHRFKKGEGWETLFENESFAASATAPLGFDENPNILYYQGLHDGRDSIFKADLSQSPLEPELVYADDYYDVGGDLFFSRVSKKVVGLRHWEHLEIVFWDEDYKRLQKSIDKALPGTTNRVVDFSADERKVLILASSDVDAGSYLLWDRDKGTMNAMAYSYRALEPSDMSEKRVISYQARDGLSIEGYLTRPKGRDDEKVPAIIFPHGGPIGADDASFDYWTQYFANRGYAVLQMNFRGSAGYGHDFMTQGLQDWGGKMQTDVEDGTRWLIEQDIIDPQKICIVGASYGGYAALMEAANNPKLYQCAVSFAGVTDLKMLVANSRKYTNHKVVKEQIGSNSKQLKSRSPVNRAGEINIPVLLAQGTKDLSVSVSHGRKMHKRLLKADKKVEYLELDEGTHYLSNEEHRVAFFKAMDAFLKRHLN